MSSAHSDVQHSFLSACAANRHQPIAIALMLTATLVLIAATAWRTERNYAQPSTKFDWSNRGLSDFHNGTYLPAKAFLNGQSPYSGDVADEYEMCRATPPYSPVVFIINSPFGLLPLPMADVVFFIFNIGLLAAIAYCCLAMTGQPFRWFDFLAILNLILLSRPGHITLFTGYFTAEIVLGCLLALHHANSRPALSATGMVLASIKPNFVIPLMLLMLFRKNYRALAFGMVFCLIAATAGLGWLSYHNGISQTINDIAGGQQALHVDPTEMPVNTWTRVDALGMTAKLTDWIPGDTNYLVTMFAMICVVGPIVRRATKVESNHGAAGLSAFISIIVVLLSLYHHTYDCLLLAVPAISVLFFGRDTLSEIPVAWRRMIGVFVAIPAVNYLSTKSVLEWLGLQPLSLIWQAVTLINGTSLVAALMILIFFAMTRKNSQVAV